MNDNSDKAANSLYLAAFISGILSLVFFLFLRFLISMISLLSENTIILTLSFFALYCALWFCFCLILKSTVFRNKTDSSEYKATLFFTAGSFALISLSLKVLDSGSVLLIEDYLFISAIHTLILSIYTGR